MQELFRLDQGTAAAFFDRMPELFAAGHGPENAVYQRLLYTIEHDFTPEDVQAILGAYGHTDAPWSREEAESVILNFDRLKYPQVQVLGRLRAVPGLTLEAASLLLHFFHHAYPIYNQATCKGLARLGCPVPFVRVREPAAYEVYIAAIELLKEKAPYWAVPETNIVLGRIVQAALQALGEEDD